MFSEFTAGSDQIPTNLPLLENKSLDTEITELKNFVDISITETDDDFFALANGPVIIRCSKDGLVVLVYVKGRESYEAGLRRSSGLDFDLIEGSSGVDRVRVLSGGTDELMRKIDEFVESTGFVKVENCVKYIWPEQALK
jgi:hypothetical protein